MKELNTNKFVFRDPVFSINKKHTKALCEEIINQNLKITYLIETHLNNLDDEMLDLLYKSGLRMVYVGIESADDKVLSDMSRFTIKSDKVLINNCLKDGLVMTMFKLEGFGSKALNSWLKEMQRNKMLRLFGIAETDDGELYVSEHARN